MPQASPINWTLLSISLVTSQLINLTIINYNNNNTELNSNVNQNTLNWTW